MSNYYQLPDKLKRKIYINKTFKDSVALAHADRLSYQQMLEEALFNQIKKNEEQEKLILKAAQRIGAIE